MGVEASIARRLTRLLIDIHGEQHASGWTAAPCTRCGKVRHCRATSMTRHTRILWRRWQKRLTNVNCEFCGASIQPALFKGAKIDSQWQPGRPLEKLIQRANPSLQYKQQKEQDDELLPWFDRVLGGTKSWKGNFRLGGRSVLYAFVFAIVVGAVTHFSGLGRLWMFADNSGSPLVMLATVVAFLIGLIWGGRNVAPDLIRKQLQDGIGTYGMDVNGVGRAAAQSGSRYAVIAQALDGQTSD